MANAPGIYRGYCKLVRQSGVADRRDGNKLTHCKLGLLVAAALLASLVFAEATPQVTSAEPSSGRVNDNVTLTGQNLGKGSVSAVFLSDDKNDYMAPMVEQAADKIIMKVPQVKPGDYNVSVQVADKIFIMPVRFKVLG